MFVNGFGTKNVVRVAADQQREALAGRRERPEPGVEFVQVLIPNALRGGISGSHHHFVEGPAERPGEPAQGLWPNLHLVLDDPAHRRLRQARCPRQRGLVHPPLGHHPPELMSKGFCVHAHKPTTCLPHPQDKPLTIDRYIFMLITSQLFPLRRLRWSKKEDGRARRTPW